MRKRRRRRQYPLDDRHYRAIALLANARDNYEEIAQAVGVSRMSLYRWRKRADFSRELRTLTDRIHNERKRELHRKYALKTPEDIEWYFRMSGMV